MDRIALLNGDSQKGDQPLETDIMRFVAIIGIVFWIIFSLINTIPFKPKRDTGNIEKVAPSTKEQPAVDNVVPEKKEKLSFEKPVLVYKNKAVEQEVEVIENKTESPEPEKAIPRPAGVLLQFKSLEDLLSLMAKGKVFLFCRAKAKGFDLIFSGVKVGEQFTFKATDNLPSSLWEIKSGKDYEYFLSLLSKSHSAISTFPVKQVMVSFTDSDFDNKVAQTLESLNAEGRNGIISISRDSEITFKDFNK